MIHNYKVKTRDMMMDQTIVMKCESDVELTKEDIIKKWNLDGPDIAWYKVYEVVDGKEILM